MSLRARKRPWQGGWVAAWLLVLSATFSTALNAQDATSRPAQDTEEMRAEELRWQQAQQQRQQERLRARIAKLQRQIEARTAARQDARDALRASEQALSTLNRQVRELAQAMTQARAELARVQAEIAQTENTLAARRAALAEQLRAQYRSGLSPWTALLAGDNPQALGRELAYLDYVARARAGEVTALRAALAQLEDLRAQARSHEAQVQRLQAEAAQRQSEVQAQQRAHATVLAKIDGALKAQRAEAKRLAEDEARLSALLDGLAEQLARLRAEAERRAQTAAAAPPAGSATTSPSSPSSSALPARLPRPVAGRILTRFGAAQPSGGTWRGVVLQAAEGTSVLAVADGTVVYGDWLRGFGNLLILDHGEELLTVYAYTQSLLKQVGEAVRAGEAIATVGASGGQSESGLYFEVRHRGSPLDPAKFFAR